jgi:hypothetical protein
MEYKFNTLSVSLGIISKFFEKRKTNFNHGNKLYNQSIRYTHSIAGNVSDNKEVLPIMVYENADSLKLQLVRENKGKSGIYR